MAHTILIKNIKGLVGIDDGNILKKLGAEMSQLTIIENAFLLLEDGKIKDFGEQTSNIKLQTSNVQTIDATGKFVLPSFVDSHTHLVFAASREEEFVMRIKGKSYEEIAAAGGGILNSAKKLQAMSEDELFENALLRLNEMVSFGTGAVEIKSG